MLKMVLVVVEALNIKILNVYGLKLSKSRVNLLFSCKIYRPPHSTVQWNPIFEVCMENVLKEEKELYLIVDFNRDLLNVQIKMHGLIIRNLLI